MAEHREQRKKIWIDKLQTYVFVRLAVYFVFYQVAAWTFLLVWREMSAGFAMLLGESAGAALSFAAAAVMIVVLFAVFIYDTLRFTHRIVGPIYRFRKTVQAINAGEEVPLIQLREGDQLHGLKEDVNQLLRLLEERGVIVIKKLPAKQESKQPVSV
ncbi:MAG: hypothetical protein L0Y72_25490 [Gemmataceae bacterium]|nr:hypothetical protein [Gemmataceae bacterium]MCI0742400.1 hypothetical protein [Gemmataceae bacterium]